MYYNRLIYGNSLLMHAGETFALTLNNGASSASARSYSVDNVYLSQSNLVSDFGITNDRRLLLKNRINNVVSKSMQHCGILFRSQWRIQDFLVGEAVGWQTCQTLRNV
jgi:hypothetical protein